MIKTLPFIMKLFGRNLIAMYSEEHKKYLKKLKKEKFFIIFFRIFIIIFLLLIWEILARFNIINTFLMSSPSKIIITTIDLFKNYNLISHIFITSYETILSFSIATGIGILIASIFWINESIAKIFDPYLTILNSLPKVSLGPLIIIWMGANTSSIILMAILIEVFTTIISLYNAFIKTDYYKIILFKSLGASKFQIFIKLVFRGNLPTLINTLKINVSLSLIGVIMGELLVSKKGLGYLINFGSQTFNLNLVITSIFILGILSYIFYIIIDKLNKYIKN